MQTWKIPTSVIDYYEPYRRKRTKMKSTTILNTKFEVDEKYEVLDASI